MILRYLLSTAKDLTMNRKKINIISIPILIEKARQDSNMNTFTTVQVNKKTAKLLKLLSNIKGEKIGDLLDQLTEKEIDKILRKNQKDLKEYQKGEKLIRDEKGNLCTLKEFHENRRKQLEHC
jgi:hypothetical protein